MDYSSIFDIYCAFACFTFILAGVFCGVVRWCHMCAPTMSKEVIFILQGDILLFCRSHVVSVSTASVRP